MSRTPLAALFALCMAGPLGAEDLTGLWSWGLTSIRTGTPLIEEGGRHAIDPADVAYGYNLVIDREGRPLSPTARPLEGGEQLVRTADWQADANTREYARIVSIMAPIRDGLLYGFESMTRAEWLALTEALTLNGIKTEDAPSLDRRAVLSTAQIWDYVAAGPGDGSPVMRYLEEAGLELKCLAFTGFDFTNPEGKNHCAEQGLAEGSGLVLP